MKYWDQSWSLVEGCSPVSPSCENCWLAGMEYRFDKIPGLLQVLNGIRHPKFSGNVICREDRLDIPIKTRKSTIFAVWSDLFHKKVPDKFINKTMRVIALAEKHTFLILTKRPERMKEFFEKSNWDGGGFPYVWLGTTVENQEMANKRIPELLKCTPFNLFLSIEPMLEEIDLKKHLASAIGEYYPYKPAFRRVICGCESGPHSRETKEKWVRDLRDQCLAVDVGLWVKQLRVSGKMVYSHTLSTIKREELWHAVNQEG